MSCQQSHKTLLNWIKYVPAKFKSSLCILHQAPTFIDSDLVISILDWALEVNQTSHCAFPDILCNVQLAHNDEDKTELIMKRRCFG